LVPRLSLLLALIVCALAPGFQQTSYPNREVPAVQKLRTFCKACHGLGDLRFLKSDDDDRVWRDLFQTASPKSGKIWARAIVEVLSWPTDSPPPADQMMIPPDRQWMPVGYKRILFSRDVTEGRSTRSWLIQKLSPP
jgi:hypothetical protein